MSIGKTSQDAIQADGISQLVIVGEVHEILCRNKVQLSFDALVCEHLNGTDILGGMNFLYDNSVVPDARRQTISVGKLVFPETNPLNVSKSLSVTSPISSLAQADLNSMKGPSLRSRIAVGKVNIPVKTETILMPGSKLVFKLPPNLPHDHPYVIQPVPNHVKLLPGRPSSQSFWPGPRSVVAKKNNLELVNETDLPISLHPTESIAIARPLLSSSSGNVANTEKIDSLVEIMKESSSDEGSNDEAGEE